MKILIKLWKMTIIFFFFLFITNIYIYYFSNFKKNDDFENKIKINKRINRIVSLAPSITEIIFLLEAQNKLVGVSQYSDYPLEACQIESIGSFIKPNIEKIIELNPDICLCIKDNRSFDIKNNLKVFDISVYIIDSNSLLSVLSTIIDIGNIIDKKSRSRALVDFLLKRIGNIRKMIDVEKSYRLFFQIGISPIISVGNETIIDDIISLAMGSNILKNAIFYPSISLEKIIFLNPKIILSTSILKDKEIKIQKKIWKSWAGITDISEKSIFFENPDLFHRPSFRLIDGLEIIANRIHPKLFGFF